MECVQHKSEIKSTFKEVRDLSYQEKKNPVLDDSFSNEELINSFLDTISDFKARLNSLTDKLTDVNEKMERITWLTDLNEQCLYLLNDLISCAKDLHSTLIRNYVKMSFLRKEGIAKAEIKAFKNAADDLKETFQDLESVFFFLPKDPEYTETTRQLSLI